MTPAMARAAPLYKQKPLEEDGEEDADRGKIDAPASGGAGDDKGGGGSMWDVVSKGVSSAAESAKIGAEKTKLRAEVIYAENRLASIKREFGEPCYELFAKDDNEALRVRRAAARRGLRGRHTHACAPSSHVYISAQARFEKFKPGVDELEAEIAEKKRWLVQLDSPGGEKEVRELMRRRKSGLGAAGGATDPDSMTTKYGLAPRPKSERPTAAEKAAVRSEENGGIAADLASWIPGAGGAGAAQASSSSSSGETSIGASKFLGLGSLT